MSKFPMIFLASALFLGIGSALATDSQATGASDALRLFTQCDASLFKALKENKTLLGPSVIVQNQGTAATIKVANPLAENGQEQLFTNPLEINGIQLISWHNEVLYEEHLGGFLFWGFKANGTPQTIAEKLNAILTTPQKLEKTGDTWARAEIHVIGDPLGSWRPNRASAGIPTPKGSVERVLLLESEAPGQTSIFCSLQGSLTPPLIQLMRPDLTTAEYPQ
ncbi:hypothetical protein [Azospira inquinata]|uniref:Uncharacterized protein n=1 Tax=Azospira inquinata TaxID=2785627 RepID=A0A975XTM4_9RHOO|nr:hypothetical protein [Azospira inquinata]QWT46781.1 hypothetical protein J8L76_03470 [Azospira inquinata]QWT47896.1 hypothetical protein Azoinq_08395 [Azospira inquinata]